MTMTTINDRGMMVGVFDGGPLDGEMRQMSVAPDVYVADAFDHNPKCPPGSGLVSTRRVRYRRVRRTPGFAHYRYEPEVAA